ncbi:MAG TPA: hypothetical protein EYQ27_00360 [Gemmatimonadetes bacterium]|nr:hypothetical protein [Gemmatimonadota bacterium]
MSSERRYSEEEIARILDEATEAQQSNRPSDSPGTGLTLSELEDIGRDVGISPALISRAAARIDIREVASPPQREFLWTTIGVGQTANLDRTLTDAEWARLVVDLRETFDARGHLSEEGPFRQWTNGNLQALLEPTESGQQLRLKTQKGDAAATLATGAVFMGLAPAMLLLGTVLDPVTFSPFFAPVAAGFFATVGALVYAGNRVRLSKWAATRQLQMAGIAHRLTAALESAEPDVDIDEG